MNTFSLVNKHWNKKKKKKEKVGEFRIKNGKCESVFVFFVRLFFENLKRVKFSEVYGELVYRPKLWISYSEGCSKKI